MLSELPTTPQMREAADALGTGHLILVYRDGDIVFGETSNGTRPYTWKEDHWIR